VQGAKYGLLSLIAAAVAYRGGWVIVQARVLQITHIAIHGNERLSNGEVLAILNGMRGENVMWTDLEAWRTRLLASPWVRDASLRRSLPSTIDIVISEREPLGIARVGGNLYLVDERGATIDDYGPQYADLDLPIIDGLAAPGLTDAADDPHAELAGRVLASLRAKPEIAKQVSQIDVRDLHNATVIVAGDPAVLYVGDDRFAARLESYLDLASALRERVADIDYVDLRFDDRIYVKPVSGGRRDKAAAAAQRSGGSTRRR
jgi:cell division protein FtsQ